MIPFRQHVVSLVAVFLALAAGVVLGGGPLSDVGDQVRHRVAADTDASTSAAAAYGDRFAAAAGTALLPGRLQDRGVALVTLPGADERHVEALSGLASEAGGEVTARYRLTPTLLDPSEKALVDTLGSQLAEQQQGAVEPDAATYERLGELLGHAIAAGDPAGAPRDAGADALLRGITAAELVTAPRDPGTRPPLVLVLLGDPPEGEGADAITAGLVRGLGRAAAGVVVAGTLADGAEDGQLAYLRGEPVAAEVTTVDGVDTAAGRVTAVLALARTLQEGAEAAAYGASGEDGAAPLG